MLSLHQKKKRKRPLNQGSQIHKIMARARRLGNFTETKEKVEFTFHGWDGTGYNGDGKIQKVWRLPNDDTKYICKWMPCFKAYCILKIDEEHRAKETNLPTAFFVNDFEKQEMENITL